MVIRVEGLHSVMLSYASGQKGQSYDRNHWTGGNFCDGRSDRYSKCAVLCDVKADIGIIPGQVCTEAIRISVRIYPIYRGLSNQNCSDPYRIYVWRPRFLG